MRRRNRADRKPRRQTGLAAHQAALPRCRRSVSQADRRQQRRDAGLRYPHRRSRRGLVQVDGGAALLSGRARALHVSDHRQQRGDPLRGETHYRHGRSEICAIWTTEQYRHTHRLRERRRRTPRLFRNRSRQSDNGAIDLRNGGRNKMGPAIESGNSGRQLGQSFACRRTLQTQTKTIGWIDDGGGDIDLRPANGF